MKPIAKEAKECLYRPIEKNRKRKRITDKVKDELQRQFLKEYRKPDVTLCAACKTIDFTRQHIYKWAETDPEFAREFEMLRFMKKKKSKEEAKKKWDEYHKFDDKYKQEFLKLYENAEHSVVSALDEMNKTAHIELTWADVRYWKKTDIEFKKQYQRLKFKNRPRLAQGTELRAIARRSKLQERKNRFLTIYREKLFSITKACKAMGIRRGAVNEWKTKDPDFRAALNAIEEEKLDFIEDALFNEIDNRTIAAIIFAAKCKLKERGYIEQPQNRQLSIEHTHKLDQDQLDAIVRGQQIDRDKYRKILKLNDPDVIDIQEEIKEEIKEETETETNNE
ncbi:MAG: hypothetical protein DRI33_04470 [Caldiserica bacterium]|nr:MAG: hypothetical protein DRI33_04470 [Caldisericota bacterium]